MIASKLIEILSKHTNAEVKLSLSNIDDTTGLISDFNKENIEFENIREKEIFYIDIKNL